MRRLAFTLLLVVAAGCGSDKSTAPKRVEGTYTLKTISGSTPPVIIYDDVANNQRIEVLSSTLTINSGGTFSSPWSFRVTDNGAVSPYDETCTGSFTRSGNTLSLTETDNGAFCGGTFDATWDGNNTITEGNVIYTR
jgi:hypothetical protein